MGGFAYHVPLDPDNPEIGFGTLVRPDRVRVGERLPFAATKMVDGEIVVGAEPGVWEVVAVRPLADDGRPFRPRRKGAEDAIRSDGLLLRRAAADD